MGVLKQPRHELLVREFIKCGEGALAYERVAKKIPGKPLRNPRSAAVCACRILAYPEVQARYRELQANMAKRADITEDKILTDYQQALELAKAQEKPADIVNAATAQAKLVGLLRDRVETGQPGDFDSMENISDILEKIATEAGPQVALSLAKAFGLELVPGSEDSAAINDASELEEALPPTDAIN